MRMWPFSICPLLGSHIPSSGLFCACSVRICVFPTLTHPPTHTHSHTQTRHLMIIETALFLRSLQNLKPSLSWTLKQKTKKVHSWIVASVDCWSGGAARVVTAVVAANGSCFHLLPRWGRTSILPRVSTLPPRHSPPHSPILAPSVYFYDKAKQRFMFPVNRPQSSNPRSYYKSHNRGVEKKRRKKQRK